MERKIDLSAYEKLKTNKEYKEYFKRQRVLAPIIMVMSIFFLYCSFSANEISPILLILTFGLCYFCFVIAKAAYSKPHFVQYATVCEVIERKRTGREMGADDRLHTYHYYNYGITINGQKFEQKCDSVNQGRKLFQEGDEVIVWQSGRTMPMIVKR